jgi:hypothetical protein
MAKAPMTDRLDNAITALADLSGWKPEKAADHVATIAETMVDRASEKAKAAALKMFTKPTAGKRGRKAAAV